MRDDEYLRTAKALARETKMSDASAARVERELLSAMTDRKVARPPFAFARSASADGGNRSDGWLGGRKWLAAAAAAVAVLIAGGVTLRWGTSALPQPTPAPAKEVVSDRPSIRPEAAPNTTVVTKANAPRAPHGTRSGQRSQTARVVSPKGFVELPWSAGLPAFESGEIVRVEVPVASLPAYGFDISSGTNRSVEADVLVGQDGLARAMRLVNSSARSTQ